MTYPPQQPGPYGGQDPYGQQPGGYGQQPGRPPGQQRPGPYGPPPGQPGPYGPPPGGQGPYGPPPGGQGPYGPPPGGPPAGFGPQPGGFGPGGPPPRGSKKGLWFGLGGGAVVVVAALLITGLVAPGWMLGGNSPRDVAQTVADAFNNKNLQQVKDVACKSNADTSSLDRLQSQMQKSGVTAHVTLKGDPQINGDSANEKVNVKVHGGPGDGQTGVFVVKMKKEDGNWCASGLDTEPSSSFGSSGSSSSGSGSGSSTGEALPPSAPPTTIPVPNPVPSNAGSSKPTATKFVQAVNSKDVAGASKLACQAMGSKVKAEVKKAVSSGIKVTIQKNDDFSASYAEFVRLNVVGAHGVAYMTLNNTKSHWCVTAFSAATY